MSEFSTYTKTQLIARLADRKRIIKEMGEKLNQLAWLQSQVIVIKEGSEVMVGDVLTWYDSYYKESDAIVINAETNWDFIDKQKYKILARICPTEGKLKAVVYKKGVV